MKATQGCQTAYDSKATSPFAKQVAWRQIILFDVMQCLINLQELTGDKAGDGVYRLKFINATIGFFDKLNNRLRNRCASTRNLDFLKFNGCTWIKVIT